MKIALVALPLPEDSPLGPPLPLAYVAAILEQQRHIVRIYDLALADRTLPIANALVPLRTFRPHLIVIVSPDTQAAEATFASVADLDITTLHLWTNLRYFEPEPPHIRPAWQINGVDSSDNEQNLIFRALQALAAPLDDLPFPARHLLPLEQYQLSSVTGELQTSILTGHLADDQHCLRTPALLIAELQTIAREHGIRHALFLGPPLTRDPTWLRELLFEMVRSDIGMRWEGTVRHQELSRDLLNLCKRAGCEALTFQFSAMAMLDSRSERAALSELVQYAHELGMSVYAQIELEPPYDAIPALVDMSATFGLDDAQFQIQRRAPEHAHAATGAHAPEKVAEMAHMRYRSRRSRQFFIDRFGPQLGPMLWRVGRTGLLGRMWQSYADGGSSDRAPI